MFQASIQMFHMFQTYAANILSECCMCCNGYIHMLQAYVANVSSFSYICCRSVSCFNISRRRKRAYAEVVLCACGKQNERGWSPPACVAVGMGAQQHACRACQRSSSSHMRGRHCRQARRRRLNGGQLPDVRALATRCARFI
jgi:hypothetical protein